MKTAIHTCGRESESVNVPSESTNIQHNRPHLLMVREPVRSSHPHARTNQSFIELTWKDQLPVQADDRKKNAVERRAAWKNIASTSSQTSQKSAYNCRSVSCKISQGTHGQAQCNDKNRLRGALLERSPWFDKAYSKFQKCNLAAAWK